MKRRLVLVLTIGLVFAVACIDWDGVTVRWHLRNDLDETVLVAYCKDQSCSSFAKQVEIQPGRERQFNISLGVRNTYQVRRGRGGVLGCVVAYFEAGHDERTRTLLASKAGPC